MNLGPCWIYDVNLAASVQNNRNSAFFLEYPVLGSLVRPIINNTYSAKDPCAPPPHRLLYLREKKLEV